MNLLKRLFDHEYKELKRFTALADKIVALEDEYSKRTFFESRRRSNSKKTEGTGGAGIYLG